MVFQQPNPFPMSVFDNIAYVLREQGSRRQRKKALEPKVHSALERAGLFEEVKDNLDHPALRSPAASSSGSASPGLWPPNRRCCCSTSPARPSTRSRPR